MRVAQLAQLGPLVRRTGFQPIGKQVAFPPLPVALTIGAKGRFLVFGRIGICHIERVHVRASRKTGLGAGVPPPVSASEAIGRPCVDDGLLLCVDVPSPLILGIGEQPLHLPRFVAFLVLLEGLEAGALGVGSGQFEQQRIKVIAADTVEKVLGVWRPDLADACLGFRLDRIEQWIRGLGPEVGATVFQGTGKGQRQDGVAVLLAFGTEGGKILLLVAFVVVTLFFVGRIDQPGIGGEAGSGRRLDFPSLVRRSSGPP